MGVRHICDATVYTYIYICLYVFICEVCDMYLCVAIVSYVYMYEGVVYVLVSVGMCIWEVCGRACVWWHEMTLCLSFLN